MKTKLILFFLAAAVASLSAQAPATPAPPATSDEARQAIEEFIKQGNPGQPAATPTPAPAAATAQPGTPLPVPDSTTLPTPGSRPTPVPRQRQLPPGFQPPGAATAQQPVAPGAPPAAAGQVAPNPAAGDSAAAANIPNPDELMNDDALNLGGGATMEQLMDIYGELTGRILLKPATLAAPANIELKIPKGSLTRKEMVQAIDTYLSLNGLTTVPMGEKFVLLVPNAEAAQQGAAQDTAATKDLPEASQFTTKIVQLKHVKPSELSQILPAILKTPANSFIAIDSTQTLMLRDYAINIKRAMELIEAIDIAVPVEYKTELIPIKYALANDIGQVLGQLTTGGSVTSVGSSGASGGFGTTGGMGGIGGAGGIGGVGGAGGIGGQQNRFGTQQNRTGLQAGVGASATGRNAFQQRLQQLTSQVGGGGGGGEVQILGETKIIADERTNSLLIFANSEDMETIKEIVAKMDVVLAQVLIESIILEVSLGDSMNINLSAARRDQSGSTNNFASLMNNGLGFLNFAGNTNISSIGNNAPGGLTWFGQFGDDFALALNMAAQDNRIKVLSRPSVQTSHAKPAALFVGETRPYITGSYFDSFGGTGSSRSQYQQLQIGLQLQVLPLINPEGLVVMEIQQSVQQVAGSVTIDGNDVPVTQDQNASAYVAVKDQDTIILGGFIQNTMSRNSSGVPFLKDIPLLGNLFKSRSRNDNRRELVVLIRPTVLETPADAAKLVDRRKDTTPNVKEAEVDFEIEQQKQLDDANEAILKKRLGLPAR